MPQVGWVYALSIFCGAHQEILLRKPAAGSTRGRHRLLRHRRRLLRCCSSANNPGFRLKEANKYRKTVTQAMPQKRWKTADPITRPNPQHANSLGHLIKTPVLLYSQDGAVVAADVSRCRNPRQSDHISSADALDEIDVAFIIRYTQALER